jgi:AraC-like DNA-binding protein
MRAAGDLDAYRADPVGAYVVGRRWLAFCARADLWGFAIWGRPTAEDLRRLLPVLAIELAPPADAHGSFVDARRIEAGDPGAFGLLVDYVRTNFAALARQVKRLAIVRPSGLAGATVAGFFAVQDAPYAVKVFDDAGKAAAWLGATASLVGELDDAVAAASGVPPVVAELRAWLEDRLGAAALPGAARSLRLSPRSLQRKLAEASTTFQRELDGARVRVAQRMLVGCDATLTEVAYDVGCASPQHFSALFRRVVGEAPSKWRQRTVRVAR